MEENQQPPVNPPVAAPEREVKPKKSSSLTMFLAIALIAVSALAIFFAWQNQKLVKSLREQIAKNQLTPTPTASQTPNGNLADWKTYTDSVHKFTLKHPPDWTATKTSPSDWAVTFCNNECAVSFRVTYSITGPYTRTDSLNTPERIEEWKNYYLGSTSFSDNGGEELSKKKVLIDGKEAIEYLLKAKEDSFSNYNDERTTWIFIPRGKEIMHLSGTWKSNPIIFDKILSTFKFLNEASSSPSPQP